MKTKSTIRIISAVIFALTNISCSRPQYRIIDLGTTIGGRPRSVQAINDLGQVVGSFGHAFVWDGNSGRVDLGTLGGRKSDASAINNVGQIVGYAETADGNKHAFLWDNINGMIDLGIFSGSESYAVAINDLGQVVGSADINETVTTAPLKNAPNHKVTRFLAHAFIWNSNSGMTDLGTLGGKESRAVAINNLGQVAGIADTDSNRHVFFWDSTNGMKDLGPLGDIKGYIGINDTGQVVSSSWRTASRNYVSFLWSSSVGVVYFDTLSGGGSCASAINDNGQVVGWSNKKAPGGGRRACLWDSSGNIIELGTIGDFFSLIAGSESMAFAINNAGQVVGWSGKKHTMLCRGYAFLWDTKHGMVKLENLLADKSGWKRLISASHINNRGQIIGFGETKDGKDHAFLMTPVKKDTKEKSRN